MKTCALVVACTLIAACGKKGPPLLPYVRAPLAAEITGARRIGNDVCLTVSVPTADMDEATPSSVREIQVYALTSTTALSVTQFLSIATPVAVINVARYADPSDKSGKVVPDPKTGALQGASVTICDTLTPDEMIAREVPAPTTTRPAAAPVAEAPNPEALRRFYLTIPFSERRRKQGVTSKMVDVSMAAVPARVLDVRVDMNGRSVQVAWEPSGGLLGWLIDRALPVEAPPVADDRTAASPGSSPAASAASGPIRYNVYREIAPDPLLLPPPTPTESASVPAAPINAQPHTTLSITDEVPLDERKRCYRVRAVRGSDAQRVESEPSELTERSCIVPVDTEPPAAVTGLTATAVEGLITIRWEPNGEEDLRGYLVLRGEAGDDTLLQLTPLPIAATRWLDEKLTPGRMYTYVVQAVDNRIPAPNVSNPTEVTATAR